MLNFIVCDDNKEFLRKEKQIIDSFMMKYDIDYKCYLFEEYDKRFESLIVNDLGFKIYLLDIQTNNGSGLDIARKIREEYDDWVSIIILVTAFNEFKYEALGNRLYLFDFINKLNKCDIKIKEDLERAMKHYDNRQKTLTYEYNHVVRKIEYRHIIYIEKESDSKRCSIKTTNGEQLINKSLNDTLKLLDERFIKINRSTIINADQIFEFDLSDSTIILNNSERRHQVSRSMKKEVKDYVRCSK